MIISPKTWVTGKEKSETIDDAVETGTLVRSR